MGRKPIPPVDPNNLTDKEKNRLCVRRYQQENRERKLADSREFRKNNPEYFKRKKKEERERIKNDPEYGAQEKTRVRRGYQKNRDKIIARQKAYADSHVEELKAYRRSKSEHRSKTASAWNAAHKEHVHATYKAWRKANMHIVRKHIALRRAREINATIGDPKAIALWEKEWKSKPTNTCEWCRMEVPTEICQSDHAEPLILGGAHNLDNLVIACQPCNNRKRSKPLAMWLETLGRD